MYVLGHVHSAATKRKTRGAESDENKMLNAK